MIGLKRIALFVFVSSFCLACGCRKEEANEIHQREACLKQTLHIMRQAIDQYTIDHSKAPLGLSDLVKSRYFREIPKDPITGSAKTWQVVQEDTLTSVDQSQPGIVDVHSGSDRISSEGTPYSSW